MTNVVPLFQSIEDIHVPAPLRDLPIFLCWRLEPRYDGDPKPRKVPYYPLGNKRVGRQGAPEDRSQLTKFAVARDQAAKRGMTGIGIALLDGYDLVAIDVDNCVTDGKLPSEILHAVGLTYAEYSPSGRGIRAIMRGNLGNHKAPTTDTDYGFEVFSTTGFCTLTGNPLDHIDILGLEDTVGNVSPGIKAICERRFSSSTARVSDPDDFMAGHEPKLNLTVERMQELLTALDPNMGREDWIKVGMALHHETEGGDDGLELWDYWSSEGATYPSTEGLRVQWDSFKASTPGQRRITMRTVIRMALASGNITTVEGRVGLTAHLKSEPAEQPGQKRFQIFSPSELAARAQPQWLIKGIMPEKSLMMVYGKSGSSKTFAVLDAAAHMGLGKDWNGRKTIRGRTIYIAAEGGGGITKRLQALAVALNVELDQLDIGCIVEPPNFLEEGDIDEVILRLKEYGPVSLLITDTLAQVTPGGDENASIGMGVAIANAQRIIREVETAVLLVHHAGKDESKGARGWSGLRAAMDAEFEVKSRGDVKEIRVTKMKDGEEGQIFAFQLEQHDVGVDADGEPITSCALRYIDYVPQAAHPRKFGKAQGLLIKLREALDVFNDGLSRGDLLEKALAKLPAPAADKKDNRRSNLERTLKGLIEQGHLVERDDLLFEGES